MEGGEEGRVSVGRVDKSVGGVQGNILLAVKRAGNLPIARLDLSMHGADGLKERLSVRIAC